MKTPSSSRRTSLIVALVAILSITLVFVFQRGNRDVVSSGTPQSKNSSVASAPQAPTVGDSSSPRMSNRVADRLLEAEGAQTDVTLSSFPQKEYQHLRAPGGKAEGAPAGEAYIHVPSASRRVAMNPNQLGEFPAIETRLNDTVGVRVELDSVKPGTPVRVVIMDGGSFPTAEGTSKVLKAADWRGVAFEYTTSANVGTHRVLVQAVGQPARIFDFSAHDAKDGWPAPSTVSTN